MNPRFFVLLVLSWTAAGAYGSSYTSSSHSKHPTGQTSVMRSILMPWTLLPKSAKKPDEVESVNWKQLSMTLKLDPLPLSLSENHQIKATLQLANRGKRLMQLGFPTTQRIEVLVRNADGKVVEQWSEDQSFNNEPTLVAVNPGERLEYSVSVSTRDMVAGQSYTIETFFPHYDQLKATKVIVPGK